mmetsp:Transcript_19563/g.42446  ORF Transcript_19563/g.42446 Transcript_19563/m.42446 type:complete len:203 (-) Transcript_19563:703-1311(-)
MLALHQHLMQQCVNRVDPQVCEQRHVATLKAAVNAPTAGDPVLQQLLAVQRFQVVHIDEGALASRLRRGIKCRWRLAHVIIQPLVLRDAAGLQLPPRLLSGAVGPVPAFITLAEAQVTQAVPTALVHTEVLHGVLAVGAVQSIYDARAAPGRLVRHAPAVLAVQVVIWLIPPVRGLALFGRPRLAHGGGHRPAHTNGWGAGR